MKIPFLAFTAFLLAPFSTLLAGVLALTSPLDYQVIQRESRDEGVIMIRGQLGDGEVRDIVIEARIG
ncbi:MAG: hypothetical protein ABI680_11985 [Chthoniobacteraceae bacterium]